MPQLEDRSWKFTREHGVGQLMTEGTFYSKVRYEFLRGANKSMESVWWECIIAKRVLYKVGSVSTWGKIELHIRSMYWLRLSVHTQNELSSWKYGPWYQRAPMGRAITSNLAKPQHPLPVFTQQLRTTLEEEWEVISQDVVANLLFGSEYYIQGENKYEMN